MNSTETVSRRSTVLASFYFFFCQLRSVRAVPSMTDGVSFREIVPRVQLFHGMTVVGLLFICLTHGTLMLMWRRIIIGVEVGIGVCWIYPLRGKIKQVFLKLDAASKVADVYLNGQPIGSHAGGYTACIFDLTEYLSFTTPNLLAVRVDNARQDVPPFRPTLLLRRHLSRCVAHGRSLPAFHADGLRFGRLVHSYLLPVGQTGECLYTWRHPER